MLELRTGVVVRIPVVLCEREDPVLRDAGFVELVEDFVRDGELFGML